MSQHLLDDSTNGSQEENGWNRVLVDEVDILHAAQGAGIVNRSDCHLGHMHRGTSCICMRFCMFTYMLMHYGLVIFLRLFTSVRNNH